MSDLRILSLGAGVQSTTMLYMAIHGEIERPDAAIFADPKWEPEAVYRHLDQVRAISEDAGIPVHIVSAGNIREDALSDAKNFASMPLYSQNKELRASQLRRQCTREYKITPIQKQIRKMLSGEIRKRRASLLMGITLDEVQRMKPSRVKYIEHEFPLIDLRMTRHDCLMWMERHGYERPPKSSCIGCPFHDNRWWRDLKENSPEEWKDAVEFDNAIRNRTRMEVPVYLHRKLIPLEQVDLSTPEDHGQASMFDDECTGYCGI